MRLIGPRRRRRQPSYGAIVRFGLCVSLVFALFSTAVVAGSVATPGVDTTASTDADTPDGPQQDGDSAADGEAVRILAVETHPTDDGTLVVVVIEHDGEQSVLVERLHDNVAIDDGAPGNVVVDDGQSRSAAVDDGIEPVTADGHPLAIETLDDLGLADVEPAGQHVDPAAQYIDTDAQQINSEPESTTDSPTIAPDVGLPAVVRDPPAFLAHASGDHADNGPLILALSGIGGAMVLSGTAAFAVHRRY